MTVVEILDQRFAGRVAPDARLERLYTGCVWAEGPAWFDGGLVWSDIPNDRMLRWDGTRVSVFRQPASFANGNTVDREGRLVTCEHGGRRVVRLERDGRRTVLADRHRGKRLNSPNDVVIADDGAVWFTDPTYGIDSNHEGRKADSEIGGNHLYRLDPSGRLDIAADDFVQPNGLAFSPGERRLYVVDTGHTHVAGGPNHIRAFDVGEGGRLSGGAVLAESSCGSFDGLRVDPGGLLWCGAGDGVHVLSPDGALVGKVRVPERVANLAFAPGPALYLCATTSLYRLTLPLRAG